MYLTVKSLYTKTSVKLNENITHSSWLVHQIRRRSCHNRHRS